MADQVPAAKPVDGAAASDLPVRPKEGKAKPAKEKPAKGGKNAGLEVSCERCRWDFCTRC